jgi:hypothetical protein
MPLLRGRTGHNAHRRSNHLGCEHGSTFDNHQCCWFSRTADHFVGMKRLSAITILLALAGSLTLPASETHLSACSRRCCRRSSRTPHPNSHCAGMSSENDTWPERVIVKVGSGCPSGCSLGTATTPTELLLAPKVSLIFVSHRKNLSSSTHSADPKLFSHPGRDPPFIA